MEMTLACGTDRTESEAACILGQFNWKWKAYLLATNYCLSTVEKRLYSCSREKNWHILGPLVAFPNKDGLTEPITRPFNQYRKRIPMKSATKTLAGTSHLAKIGAGAVRLSGPAYSSLDAGILAEVRSALLQTVENSTYPCLIVDLSRVEFFGASFVGVLVAVWDELKKRDRQLALAGLTPFCARLIRTMHLDRLFVIKPALQAPSGGNVSFVSIEDGTAQNDFVQVRRSDVEWDADLVRLNYVGDDGSPIRSVILPRREDNDG
jgi:anti-anti-sigma factor